MRQTLLLILLTALVAFDTVQAQIQMSAGTQHALSVIENDAARGAIQLNGQFPIQKIKGEQYISTIIKTNHDFKPNQLPEGVIMGSQIGDIATLRISVNSLSLIHQLKGVTHLEVSNRIQPMVDRAVKDVRADSVHMGIGLNAAYTGKDVIIGVTDWGFDYTHPMFYDTTLQNTRILGAWDQFKESGPAPSGMNYGTEYIGAAALMSAESDTACTYYDYATHGSHVAGIAGGSGADIGFRGVAYDADFLFCQFYLDGAAAIDAVKWMQDRADALGKRLVVNMSWGLYFLGPLDGTSLLSQALDNYSDEGVVIVTSGGNNGSDDFHIKKEFSNDTMVTKVDFYDYSLHTSMWGQSISMWGEPGNPFSAGFEVRNGPNVFMQSPIFNTTTAAGYIDSMLIFGSDTVWFNLTTDAAHPQNQRPHMRLRVKNTNTSLSVVLKSSAASGTVHYWNVTELSNGAGNWGMPFSFVSDGTDIGDNQYGVGEPACADKVISVAAHNIEFKLGNGTLVTGGLATFSSEGPTPDERTKPDISAPGVSVVSAVSSYTTRGYTLWQSTTFNSKTYDFAAFSGTSMASPAAAGVVALMLEANPQLSPAQVKQILINTARADDKTGTIPAGGSTEWGWGKVTANLALAEAEQTTGVLSIEENNFSEHIFIYPNPANDQLEIKGFVEEQDVLINIFTVDGKLVSTHELSASQIDISELAAGSFILQYLGAKHAGTARFIKQ